MEQLIRDLNSPQNQGNPAAVHDLQRQIQQLQQQQEAWQTGILLLNSDDQLLQFYGALTIGLKVGADWETDKIGQDRALFAQLLEQLVTCFIRLTRSTGQDVVINKLCSTLAAIFVKSDSAWGHPCRHILACLLQNGYVQQERSPEMDDLLRTACIVQGSQLRAILRLALTLQEASRSKNSPSASVEVRLSNNSADAWHIIHFTLVSFALQAGVPVPPTKYNIQITSGENEYINMLTDALQQLPLWCKDIPNQLNPSDHVTLLIRESIAIIIELLDHPASAELCISCLTVMQNDQPRLLDKVAPQAVAQIVGSSAVASWTAELLKGDSSSATNYFVDFLEATVSQADTMTDDFLRQEAMPRVLEIIQTLLKCQGAAAVEDKTAQSILDIVTCLAEGYSDWSEPSEFDEGMQTFIRQACLDVFLKSRFPEDELDNHTVSWDEDDFTGFEDYRFQASDFFQTAFGIIGTSLAETVTQPVSQGKVSWSEFEAAMFVLTAISDALSNEPERCDPFLMQVFSSQAWTRATNPGETIPGRVRRAMIKLLSETTSFLQRSPQYLISSLDFLFRSLNIRVHSNQAARAVYNLCDGQRSYLVQGLPQFMQTINCLKGLPLHSSCKIFAGVSALIQALPSEEEKIQPIQQLLQLIQDLENDHTQNPPTQDDEIYNPLFDRVSMLAAMAKGLQTPAETPIELDAPPTNDQFWTTGVGKATQNSILQMLSEPWSSILHPSQSDLVTAACDFLKAGFKEQHPMPTKFTPQVSTELLCSMISLQNPNLDRTMNTASCFVSSSGPVDADWTSADKLISRVLAVTQEATALLNDPDFAAPTCVLDFFMRSMPKYGLHILTHQSALDIMSPFINYAILLLRNTSDTLPRRSAAAFFASLVELTDPSTQLMQNTGAQASLSRLLDHYSTPILGLAMHLLAGECARSEIDSISSLLRVFVGKQPMRAKAILAEAIKEESGVLTPKALKATKPELRARFVAQVEGLRGARKTVEIARDFWLNCRGGHFGYIT